MSDNMTSLYPRCNETFLARQRSPPPPAQNVSLNASAPETQHISSALQYVDLAVLPSICALGILGNILNVVVLTRRRMVSGMDRLEKCSNFGLIALAFSDMMFCTLAFPYAFIKINSMVVEEHQVLLMYYKIYGASLLNFFLMSGIWLITVMAINRYIVVVYPFRARSILSTRRTVCSIVAVFLTSAVITLPFFLHPGIGLCVQLEQELRYTFVYLWDVDIVRGIKLYRTWLWPVLAQFIPLLTLAFCNTRLIQELRSASNMRKRSCEGQQVKDSSRKVTLTLVSIILMVLILVSPGEVIRYLNPYKMWGQHVGHVVASVLNVMQTLNFALNFVLYCAVNANFRATCRSIFCCTVGDTPNNTAQTTVTRATMTKSCKNGVAFTPVSVKADL